jgi:acid phosphatase family membrane protein YuiD
MTPATVWAHPLGAAAAAPRPSCAPRCRPQPPARAAAAAATCSAAAARADEPGPSAPALAARAAAPPPSAPPRPALARLARRAGAAAAAAAPLLLLGAVAPPPAALSAGSLAAGAAAAWAQLAANPVFVTGFRGWFAAQFLKIFTKWYKTGRFSLLAFVDSGGMPSSHSALCAAVTTAVGVRHGLASSLFAACVAFSLIVMYDAAGVRRHAGLQAEVLNAVVDDVLRASGHPASATKLKEVLGHTPRQVACGTALGIAFGLTCPVG